MYERFYQLRERPFALSPDPDYLYPSRVHQEALGYLRYGIEGHAGFVVITGEIGSGKTTLLQTLLRGLDRQTTVARLMNTMLGPEELIESILLDFGIETTGRKPVMLKQLADFLVSERTAGRLVLLVIDEAQNLSLPALEEVRMLSNLETEKSKLIQIVLVGQPDLRAKLSQPGLEQLRQRVTVSYHLNPLDADETEAYINHRLRRAAAGPPIEFPREVSDLVHARSQGIPRIVNVICDAMLLFGYGAEQHQERGAHVAHHPLAQRQRRGAPAERRRVHVGIAGLEPAGERVELDLRLGHRGTRLEPADHLEDPGAPVADELGIRVAQLNGTPDLHRRSAVLERMAETGRHHADDRHRVVVQPHRLPDDRAIASEPALEQVPRDDRHIADPPLVVLRVEVPTQRRRGAERARRAARACGDRSVHRRGRGVDRLRRAGRRGRHERAPGRRSRPPWLGGP